MPDLTSLLQSTFGFASFRANQEAVCVAATSGKDVLLVMPTGAGKSLCYQLPAIARSGTALVVSPLIALMDDQAAKLTALGLRVARVHSGLSRDDARHACRDYLDGALNFLFIAPERLRVPGFPEMLARRKPSLIAIDEAHCISAWGHDFRPDYRTLGEHLPALRPAPIIALTATATPTVQRDIVAQLQLENPALFIHGFRRSNLAIEVVEMSKPRRHEFTTQLLSNAQNRPAIVYAPSRKSAEELAAELNRHFPAAAYHAGLEPSVREHVQRDFQSGKLEVVVATIAFGMGIDKANVRTVVHTALPASIEAFYQEIGRAGRDGLPSRTVLLHDFVDLKTQAFLLDKNYPASSDVSRVLALLNDDYQMPDILCQSLGMDREVFDKAVEKLIAQACVTNDMAGNIKRLKEKRSGDWRRNYEAQRAFKQSQIDSMAAFADTQQCRMTAIIKHFGDNADATLPCGKCDVCDPKASTAQSYHQPDAEELRQLSAVLRVLQGQSRSTGKLHAELAEGALRGTPAAKDRKAFDPLLDALVRATLVNIVTDTFTNSEGNVINYKKASLTHEGREAHTGGSLQSYEILVRDTAPPAPSTRKRKRDSSGASRIKLRTQGSNPRVLSRAADEATPKKHQESTRLIFRPEGKSRLATRAKRRFDADVPIADDPLKTFHRTRTAASDPTASLTPEQQLLDAQLRAWRKAESARIGLPQFFVLGSSTLRSIVLLRPRTIAQLQTISGIGPDKAEKFGASIINICSA